jgi:NADPH-dependent curcumin reductase CurA
MGTLEELERLTTFLIGTGLRPTIDSTVGLADVPDAMRRMLDGDLCGKIVVRL